jgi:hypothetical protein
MQRRQQRQAKGRFAGLASGSAAAWQEQLFVLGLPCTLFEQDGAVAVDMEAGEHLVPWDLDPAARVDRFDVRLLLSDLRQLQPASMRTPPPLQQDGDDDNGDDDGSEAGGAPFNHRTVLTAATNSEIAAEEHLAEQERYLDLDYSREWELEHPLGRPGAFDSAHRTAFL